MVFKPLPCPTRWEGLAAAFWIVLIDLLLIVWAVRRPADMLKFLLVIVVVGSLPLLAHLLLRTWAAFTLEYWVDRNAVTVRWAYMRQIIPLPSIVHMSAGGDAPAGHGGLLDWPLPYLRSVGSDGSLQLFATRSPDHPSGSQCLLLDTPAATYVLSPADADGMIATIQERYAMGPSQVLEPERQRSGRLDRVLPDDRLGHWLLVGGLLGVLILFGVLMISFPNLPDILTVRYNSAGLPEEIREKGALYRLPIIGLLAWSINGIVGLVLARRQPMAAYMLWGGAVVVQVFSLLALVSLIT
jgi:hypothetical protein